MEETSSSSSVVALRPSSRQGEVEHWTRRAEPETVEENGPLEVLYCGEGILVINKPPDVRMQGAFKVTVETLVRHWCRHFLPPEPELKYIHQLDYATSGVLTLGYEKRAAAAASGLFQDRSAKKCYVAVVFGHVDPSKFPLLSEADLARAPSKPRLSYRPSHAYFQSHKLELAKRDPTSLSDRERQVMTLPWSEVKAMPEFRASYDELARVDKERALKEMKRKEEEEAQIQLDREVHRRPEDGPDMFVVDAPLYEVPGDFRMGVGRGPGWRAAKTVARVVERGTYRGRDVSKMELWPTTGRRHQLRLHMVRAGHPIVGDATYANDKEAPRMMLHALKLQLPFPPGEGPGRTLDLVTNDAFPFVDRELRVDSLKSRQAVS